MVVVNNVWSGRWDVGDRLLAELHLLGVTGGEEADLCRAANVSFEKAAICRSDDFNHVARLNGKMSVDFWFVLFNAHDRCAGMSDRAGCWLRISSDTRWIADNITRVAETLIYLSRQMNIANWLIPHKQKEKLKNLKNFPSFDWRHLTLRFIIVKRSQGKGDKENVCRGIEKMSMNRRTKLGRTIKNTFESNILQTKTKKFN